MLAAIVIAASAWFLASVDGGLGPHPTVREIRAVLGDPTSTTVQKDLALAAAIQLGDLTLTELAVERGADVQLRYDYPGGKACQSGPPCGWRYSALDLAVGLEQTAIASYLVSQGMDPFETTSGGVGAPIDRVKSDSMLQAVLGKRYAELRYFDQPPTAASLAECQMGTINVSRDPVVAAEVKKVMWVQRDADASGVGPFPPDWVTLRVTKVLNAGLLDIDSRFALLKHEIPDLSLAELQPMLDWSVVAPGREVSLSWPARARRQRLRPPQPGTHIILSFKEGSPTQRNPMKRILNGPRDPTRRQIRWDVSLAVNKCFLVDSPANRDAVAGEIERDLAREAKGIAQNRTLGAKAAAHQRLVDECRRDTCEHFDGSWDPARRPSCSLPMPKVDWPAVLPDRDAECVRSGGAMGTFSSTCQNDCVFETPETCGQMITKGCHCGANHCWLYEPEWRLGTCVESPSWNRQFSAGSY